VFLPSRWRCGPHGRESASRRAAVDGDLEALNEIYNHYVRGTHVTFDLDPITMKARREWFTHYATTGRHRLLVATTPTELLGYASSTRYHDRLAYGPSVGDLHLHRSGLGRARDRLRPV
jgi:phosphinothricin acetyltransferase